MLRTDTAPLIERRLYQPYPYAMPQVALAFDLDADHTRIQARLVFECREPAAGPLPPLVLQGDGLPLDALRLDGRVLTPDDYQLVNDTLTVQPVSPRFTLDIDTHTSPAQNTALMGLYQSGEQLFTQCEPEGFRRILWSPDRPDVLSRYRVTLRANRQQYPQLLSNGNLLSSRDLPDGRHEAVWEDPHPKPSYLFAVVAGRFDCLERPYVTRSGRECLLQVYCDPGERERTHWALDCLERAARWDEQRFGLELDLDRFMIVAASDFNMGAMENKGLNVFNAAYVLADPETATDAAYRGIESVIGHEYFHNWTGNRVTCRDWFQLSLKEGLTVFRDQDFSADMLAEGLDGAAANTERAVKRIDDVIRLRVAQFPEDAGPMAHPIRPDSYEEISNFYTATIYEKGAEVIRMLHTLLGEARFQQGLALYFSRHDGQAVTCDDFVDAMQDACRTGDEALDLTVFRRWYQQAGTPRITVNVHHDAATRRCTITLTQDTPPAGIEKLVDPPLSKPPLHIPMALGLLDRDGHPLPLSIVEPQGRASGSPATTQVLSLTERSQSWVFDQVAAPPVVSLLRGFSAPVRIDTEPAVADLRLLAAHDPDPYARWEAVQQLGLRQLVADTAAGGEPASHGDGPALVSLWRQLLTEPDLGDSYRARLLTLPDTREVMQLQQTMTPPVVARCLRTWQARLGHELADLWLACWQRCHEARGRFSPDPASAGRRALKHLALRHLALAGHEQAAGLADTQYRLADNLGDRLSALAAYMALPGEPAGRAAMLADSYDRWQSHATVIDKWFAVQAVAPGTTVDAIRALMTHPAFSLRNPNRARALVFQFCLNHPEAAHSEDGYAYWADQVLALDALNPEIAARLARAYEQWQRYAPSYRDAVHVQLQRVRAHDGLSANVAEIIDKSLRV